MLFVEDDPVIRQATSDYLTRNGFEVIAAEDGDAGLAAWRASDPVLALLDVMAHLCEMYRRSIPPDAPLAAIPLQATGQPTMV